MEIINIQKCIKCMHMQKYSKQNIKYFIKIFCNLIIISYIFLSYYYRIKSLRVFNISFFFFFFPEITVILSSQNDASGQVWQQQHDQLHHQQYSQQPADTRAYQRHISRCISYVQFRICMKLKCCYFT